jgi:glycine/D-amino acid oxidase-like deaminating enzyme/nitrite reductase/ring-hydroxylating ferredoxin subunit
MNELPGSRPPLPADARADVCVVGAGIAGLSTAYHLAKAGKQVIVLDDGPVGGGETSHTTAHLASAIDDRYFEIIRLHGPEKARLAAESHSAAINRIELIVQEEQLACDFLRLDGYLFNPPDGDRRLLERELEAAHQAGLNDVEMLEKAPLTSFDTGPCLRFPRQGQFHPLKYLAGLERAVLRAGGAVHGRAHVTGVEGGATAVVTTADGRYVRADAVVVATNTPVNDRVAIHTKQAPYRTYALALRVPRGSVAPALYWDTLDPYHYVRLQRFDHPDDDLLIVGGEDHKTGQAHDAAARFRRLEEWARERFPQLGAVEYAWSGQVMETVDGLAFIGRNPGDTPNVFVATGDSGMGMTHGTIAGILLSDLILGRDNPWAAVYDPGRIPVKGGWEYLKENLNVAVQYTDWLTRGEVRSVADIAPGEGAVVRRGLKKLAVYRDEGGRLHECSAVCPHMGCVVTWNSAAKSWDCPCHGSRFSAKGEVLNGPAISPLSSVAEESPAAEV